MKKASIIFTLVTALFCQQGYSQFRKYSNEFLNIGARARGLAMGSAQVATSGDATSGYWNPAGLVQVKDHPSVSFMHAEYFAGIGKYDFGSIALPIQDGRKTLALSILRFAVDDIPNTLYLVEPDGTINYNNIRTFSSADYAFLLSYAQQGKNNTADKQWSFGGNAKIIHRKVGSFAKAWGFGLDAGVQLRLKKWRFGLVARDVTTTFNAWTFTFNEREKEVLYLTNNGLPLKSKESTAPRLISAAAHTFNVNKKLALTAEANLDFTFDGKRNTLVSANPVSIDPKIGIEAAFNKTLFIRAGVSNFQQALSDGDTTNQKKVWIFQPSLGAGFKLGNVDIDYAFTNLANQSSPLYTHIFSLRVDLINNKKK